MIIEEFVDIKVGPNNIKYWKDKGYIIKGSTGGRGLKNGNPTLSVNTIDLHPNSNVIITIKCDVCFNIEKKPRKRNIDFCSKCWSTNVTRKPPKYFGSLKPDKDFNNDLKTNGKVWVAKKYNTTISIINNYCKHFSIEVDRYKGTTSKADNIDIELFVDDCNALTLREITSKYKIAQSVVKRLCDKYHITYPKKQSDFWKIQQQIVKDSFEEYKQRNQNGESLLDISQKDDVSIEVIKQKFRDSNEVIHIHSYNKSKGETEVKMLISNQTSCFSTKKMFDGTRYEIDCFVPEFNFGVEYCGEFWHSSINKDKKYHLDKHIWALKQDINLITIFEHEWNNKQDIIKSIINNKLNKSTKIYARKCDLRDVPVIEARGFHQTNHINGYVNSSINVGLYHQDVLVMVCSLSKSRFNKHYQYEITRLSSLLNHNVVGGFSKIISYLKTNNVKSIFTYADRRFGEGNVYLKNGFEYLGNTPPNYWYFKPTIGFLNRMNFQKSKLKKFPNYDDSKTETQIMLEQKFMKIYDCGNNRFGIDLCKI